MLYPPGVFGQLGALIGRGLNPKAPAGPAPGGPGGGGGGFDLAGAQAAQNKMYDQMLEVLRKKVGGSTVAINDAHRELAAELLRLGGDARTQNKRTARDIAGRSKVARQDWGKGLQDAFGDLRRQGADVQGLLAQRANGAGMLNAEGTRRNVLSARLADVLGQSLNANERLGATVRTGSLDALSAAQGLQEAAIEQERLQALQALAGGGSGGGGGFGGGGGGSAGSDDPMYDEYTALNQGRSIADDQAYFGERPVYDALQDIINRSKNDAGRQNTMNIYRDLQTGAITPAEAMARFHNTPVWGAPRSQVELALDDAQREWEDYQNRRGTLTRLSGPAAPTGIWGMIARRASGA
jgi:hypothetical protein